MYIYFVRDDDGSYWFHANRPVKVGGMWRSNTHGFRCELPQLLVRILSDGVVMPTLEDTEPVVLYVRSLSAGDALESFISKAGSMVDANDSLRDTVDSGEATAVCEDIERLVHGCVPRLQEGDELF